MKPHICFVSPYIYPSLVADTRVGHAGGAEIQQALIAKLLARHGYRVSVLTRDFGQPEYMQQDGVHIYKLPSIGQRGLKGLRWLMPRLTDIYHQLSKILPDVVYIRTATAYAAPAAWYCQQYRRRFVFAGASDTDFGAQRERHVSRRDWLLYQWGLKRAALVLAQNAHQSKDYMKVHGRVARLCPNFLIDPAAGPANFAGPVIWVGTIRALKRPELFIDLARQHPQRRFLLVGGKEVASGAAELFEQIKSKASSVPNLEMLGYIPPQEVGKIFDGASALINTSTHEGFPNTFLQAWIRGVPSLSFVNPEIRPGEGGTLACRDVADMQQKLGQLLGSNPDWCARSELVKRYFNQFHDEKTALHNYSQLLEGKPA